jgi:hypothetical protein
MDVNIGQTASLAPSHQINADTVTEIMEVKTLEKNSHQHIQSKKNSREKRRSPNKNSPLQTGRWYTYYKGSPSLP